MSETTKELWVTLVEGELHEAWHVALDGYPKLLAALEEIVRGGLRVDVDNVSLAQDALDVERQRMQEARGE